MKYTKPTSINDIKRSWHKLDVKGKVLGTASVDAAKLLIGKSKPYFANNLDCGDFVVVINAMHIVVTGSKKEDKKYSRYSGYPGGLKKISYARMQENRPEEIIRHAVSGMLPKNKLRDQMLSRLYIFKDEKHPYSNKFQESLNT